MGLESARRDASKRLPQRHGIAGEPVSNLVRVLKGKRIGVRCLLPLKWLPGGSLL